jgi:hypothetical protein
VKREVIDKNDVSARMVRAAEILSLLSGKSPLKSRD